MKRKSFMPGRILLRSAVGIFILYLLLLNCNVNAQCGVKRWKVKTLQDGEASQINFTPKQSTVHEQRSFPKPVYHDSNLRDSTEEQVYVMECTLVKFMKEADNDFHLYLKATNSNEKIIAEAPDPSCCGTHPNAHLNNLQNVRDKLEARLGNFTKSYKPAPAGTKVRLTGVGYFDSPNHPRGFKGRELHPVIDVEFL